MKKLRVLLVDDEIMIREGFNWQAHDCEVVGEAADGMEALAQIDTLKPDIAIMDINIPIMNGLKVIQLSRIKHPEIAFVIVSGYDDFSFCREALRLQITDYILKPVNYYNINITRNLVPGTMYQVIDDVEYSINEAIGFPDDCKYWDVIEYWGNQLAEELQIPRIF